MMKIYGHNVSQPTRAVVWACRMKGIDFEFINTDPLKGKTKTPDFLANVSPLGR